MYVLQVIAFAFFPFTKYLVPATYFNSRDGLDSNISLSARVLNDQLYIRGVSDGQLLPC